MCQYGCLWDKNELLIVYELWIITVENEELKKFFAVFPKVNNFKN